MRVYAYIVAVDSGFSPNPFHRWCTLACCKPAIRRTARPGDWVVGLTSRGERLVYAMKVDEVMSFAEYWQAPAFQAKKPDLNSARPMVRNGDNCYMPLGDGRFRQLPSAHWDKENGSEDEESKRRDLGGRNVLASRHFWYFGGEAEVIPPDVRFRRPGRGHRVNFTAEEKDALVRWIRSLPRGRRGRPARWKRRSASGPGGARCG